MTDDREPGEDIMLNIFEIIFPALMIAPLALAQTVFPASMPELNPEALRPLGSTGANGGCIQEVRGSRRRDHQSGRGVLDPNNINSTLNSIQTEFEIPGMT